MKTVVEQISKEQENISYSKICLVSAAMRNCRQCIFSNSQCKPADTITEAKEVEHVAQ